MYKRILLFLFIPILLTACRNETPPLDLFHLTIGTEADADIAMGLHSAEITINEEARWIEIGLAGDFDTYNITDEVPGWLTVSDAEVINLKHCFRINVSRLDDDDTRIGNVNFTVVKGELSQSGTITVTQRPLLYQ